jgi:hypothetical protein
MYHGTFVRTVWTVALTAALGALCVSPVMGQHTLPWDAAGGAGGYYLAQQPPGPAPDPEPPLRPQPAPAPAYDPYDQLAYADTMSGLASVPNMFGDFFGTSASIVQSYEPTFYPPSPGYGYEHAVALPTAGGARRVKISENNRALPSDRVYFLYNRFENALYAESWAGPNQTDPVDRYTLGAEKTFFEGWWSIEVRMPFVQRFGYEAPDVTSIGGPVGNLALNLKRLLYRSERCAWAIGLGVNTPTGSDVRGQLIDQQTLNYRLHNDAVHLLPWVGMMHMPTERCFYQAFLQVDVPTNGNRLTTDGASWGKLNDQTLMFVDLSLGYWIYRNPRARWLTAVAPVIEFHYTTTVQDTDVVTIDDGAVFYHFVNWQNRVDPMNLTVGLHNHFGSLTTLGIAGVFPLRGGENKLFDAELQIYLNRYF